MAELLDSLARYMAAGELGEYDPDGVAAGEWAIFLDHIAQSPARAIGLFTYPGLQPDAVLPWTDTRVQVRVRGDADSRTSRARALAIFNALHGLGPVELPGGLWLQTCTDLHGGPIGIGPDANGRHEHTVNFEINWGVRSAP